MQIINYLWMKCAQLSTLQTRTGVYSYTVHVGHNFYSIYLNSLANNYMFPGPYPVHTLTLGKPHFIFLPQ